MMNNRRRFMGNSLSLVASQVTQNATSLLLSISIARILGPYELGQYTLAFSYYFIFMTVSSQGLKTLLTRELAKHPEHLQNCLISGTLLQFAFSLIGYAALVILVFLLPYKYTTALVCYIVGAALIPYGISNVTEAIFQSQEKMHLIAAATIPIYILRLSLMFIALKLRYGINSVGTILVLSEVLILVIEWIFVYRIVSPMRWEIDWSFVRDTAQKVRTFLVIEGISTFQGRMQLVFLSVLASEVAVGLYGAALQFIQPFQIIAQSVIIAAFPSLTRARKTDPSHQRRLIEQVIELLFLVAMPFIVGILFIGSELLVLVYHDAEFAQAAPILNIIAFGMIAMALIRALSYLLVANGLERVNLREVITTTSIGAVLSLILIGLFGLIGAAIAALSILIIACSQYVYAVYTQLFSLNLWHIIRRPLVLSGVMALVFTVLLSTQAEILWKLLIAGGVYTLVVGIAGFYEVRARRMLSVSHLE